MKSISVLIFVFFCWGVSSAQSYLPINGVDGVYSRVVKVEKNIEIEGNPYFNEDWKPAKVKLVNNKDYVASKARINFLSKQLEFIENDVILQVPLKATKKIDLQELSTLFETSKNGVAYQRIELNGKLIWKNVACSLKDQYSYLAGKNSVLLNRVNSYFVGSDVDDLKKIGLNKKDLYLLYSLSEKDSLEKFIKTEKLNISKEEDFFKVLQTFSPKPK
jgi:hypothetical protein